LDLEVLSDRSAILWGRGTSFFAIHADSVSVHWAKRINAIGSFQVIKELPSGGYVAGINMETAGAVIARLSEGGDFLWCKSYFRPKGMISDILVESDSSFVIVGFTDTVEVGEPISFPYDQDLFLMNLDGQGNIQWTNCYQNTVPWYTANGTKLIRAWDGNYIVLVSTAFPNVNWSRFPTILKLSTTGELIWNRSYGVDDFQYGPYTAILAHSDGGYMIQGSVNGDPQSLLPYGGYIIKTDSIGHISCFERFGSVIETVEIFPVDSSFTMTSSDGAVAYESFVQDAPTGEILEADACLYNALREEDGGASYTLFPNPTTGKVTLRCIMPTDADAIIRMVDPLGKLMSTTLLVAGSSSQEVDLSSFANGVYFLIISGINDSYIQRIVLDK
jgi:hypothetical protein